MECSQCERLGGLCQSCEISALRIKVAALEAMVKELEAQQSKGFNEGYDAAERQFVPPLLAKLKEREESHDNWVRAAGVRKAKIVELLAQVEKMRPVVEAAKSWRTFHVCCPQDCPDLKDAQKKLGDSLDDLASAAPEEKP